MAKKGREAVAKRAREVSRQEKQALKRERRETRSQTPTDASSDDGAALMEEFARLSERYAANQVSEQHFNEERQRIFAELGIESPGE